MIIKIIILIISGRSRHLTLDSIMKTYVSFLFHTQINIKSKNIIAVRRNQVDFLVKGQGS